jgi:hypothetical protein
VLARIPPAQSSIAADEQKRAEPLGKIDERDFRKRHFAT